MAMKKLINFFKFFLSIFKSGTTVVNTAVQEQVKEETKLIPRVEQVQEQWFPRKNDLINEFTFTPVPVYGSHLGDVWYDKDGERHETPSKPIGYLDEYGNFYTVRDIEKRKPDGTHYIGEERTYKQLPEEELLADDIRLLKNKLSPLSKSTTHFIKPDEDVSRDS